MLYLLAFIVGGLLGVLMMAVANAASKNMDARRQQRDERR